ncbi:hypothetical protein [Novipirellula rosea]|uniref:Uncharacterized protein n=1 Tax=Novipirellula rosea TaxID=1031540 RepID=A0ABP8MST1_9BACT
MSNADTRFTIRDLLHVTTSVAVFFCLVPLIDAHSMFSPSPTLSGSIVMLLAWNMIMLRKNQERGFWIGFFMAGTCSLMTAPSLWKVIARNTDLMAMGRSWGIFAESELAFVAWAGYLLVVSALSIIGGLAGKHMWGYDVSPLLSRLLDRGRG